MTAPKFEINVGAILQGLILVALLWVGTSINTLNQQMSAVQVHVVDFADTKRRLAAVEIEQARAASVQSGNTSRIIRLEQKP